LLVEFQLHRVLSEKDARKVDAALHSLPKKIADAYQDIFERISNEGNDQRVFKTLSWIFHAKVPLLMDQLREALAVEVEDTQLQRKFLLEPALIVEECKSLITHDPASGIVRFTHSTVHQFLESIMSQRLLSVVDLAKLLLNYLSFDIFMQPCRNDSEFKARIASHSLSCYAAHWWPEYARGEGEHDHELQRLIFRLFQSSQHTDSVLQLEAMSIDIPEAGTCLIHFATFYRLEFLCRILVGGVERSNSLQLESPDLLQIYGHPEFSVKIFGDVGSRDAYGETPLHIAARLGYKEIVRLFVDANANVNAKSQNSADMTALHLAVVHGHNEIVDILIEANADLDAEGRYALETPLLLAAFLGHNEVVDTLIKANARLDATIAGVGETAIMRAFNSPKAIQIVTSLLKAGADVNARDTEGRTALHYALRHMESFEMCSEMLKLLLAAGADINIHCTVHGDTPLHTAACIDLQERQYELTLQRVEARFSEQFINDVYAHQCALETTPMPQPEHVEGAEELVEIVDLLIRAGAYCSARNFDGDTPLQCAIKFRNPAPAFMLLCAVGGRVDFSMNRLGDQDFLERISEQVLGARELEASN
jgi:ankyrin repeat protein